MEETKDDSSKYLCISDYLKQRNEDNDTIQSILKTEIRPHKIAYIEFICNKDFDETIKSFKETISNSLKLVQNGLYILLKLPEPIQSYKSPDDIINILLKLYQIIDNLSFKTHGLMFDSRIIIIYSQTMHNTLITKHLSSAKILKLDKYSTNITDFDDINANKNDDSILMKYKEAVFGGTFDHLHSGHKVLISIASLICLNTLFIGLSIDKLLAKKKYSQMLQSFDKRKEILLDFIGFIKPELKVTIEPLNDLYGPSIYESIEVLVVSKETERGGKAVNTKRTELNRKPCDLIIIDYITAASDTEEEKKDETNVHKASSTEIRCFAEKYQFLYNQWKCMMLQLLPRGDKVSIVNKFIDEWWYIIFNFYQQKQRYYHTMNHIQHLIKNCIKYSKDIENVTIVLLSIWFHDIVYDPKKHDNEIQSIEIFKIFIDHATNIFNNDIFDKELIQKVIDYIDATIKHQIKDEYLKDNDIKWFLDFDLAILSEQEDIYNIYAKNIRNEYIHVESPTYEDKRSQVMQKFLDRKELYFTQQFKQDFETIARQNVANEIQLLQSSIQK